MKPLANNQKIWDCSFGVFLLIIVLAQGIALAQSPFTESAIDIENKILTSSKAAVESIEKLKESTNATTGKYVAIDLGPLTLTVLIPEKSFPQVSIGVTGATRSQSISTSGEFCSGQTVKGGGGIFATATASKCQNLVRKDEKTASISAGVGAGAGADAASIAITAGGFVKVPFDLKKMVNEFLFPEK